MRRSTGFVLFLGVLVAGIAIGVMGRTWLDGQQSQPASEAGVAASAAAPVGAASAAGGPAVAPAPPVAAAPAPTSAPPPTAAPPPTPASRDMVVEVSESDLQSQMSAMLVGRSLGSTPLGDTKIQSVSVALRDRQIQVGGNAQTGFLTAPYTAAGTIVPDPSGRPLVRVTEASVGGVQLPDGARAALADSFQSQVDRMFADRAMKLRSVDIADGKMRLIGIAGS